MYTIAKTACAATSGRLLLLLLSLLLLSLLLLLLLLLSLMLLSLLLFAAAGGGGAGGGGAGRGCGTSRGARAGLTQGSVQLLPTIRVSAYQCL